MNAIFDKRCRLVGWINKRDKNIFGTDMRWLGFVDDDYVFTSTCKWVGGWNKGTIVDKHGKAVAWENGCEPEGTNALLQPLTPLRPLTPLTPLTPLIPLMPLMSLTPIGGWSNLEWSTLWR